MDHPMLRTEAFHNPVVRLCSAGACGFPEHHPGEHIADHALVSCPDSSTCALCLYRSNGRLARYGLTPKSLGEIFERARAKREALDALRSPAGCLNCPVCHPGHDAPAFVRSEISSTCLRLIRLEAAFERS